MKLKLSIIINLLLITGVYAQQQISNFSNNEGAKFNPTGFTEFKDKIYFIAFSDEFGLEIWHSSGDAQNTSILKDINIGSENGAKYSLSRCSTVLNNDLYFIASDGSSSGEIWKTDGTSLGTSQVTDFANGRIGRLTTIDNNIYFLIKPDDSYLQVWKSDGTTEGTVIVMDSISSWGAPSFQGKCNGTFIFTFREWGSNNVRVWRSDGTSEGTYPLTEELDGNGSGDGGTSELSQYIQHNNKLYFVSRYYLHETDGTPENTKKIARLWQASNNLVEFSDAVVLNGKLYFLFFSDDNFQLSIWESDATETGSKEIFFRQSNRYFFPSNLAITSNSLLFSGPNQEGGSSLVSLNADNHEVKDLMELSDSIDAPFVFLKYSDVCWISPVSNNDYFITSPYRSYKWKGWIYNVISGITANHNSLDNVRDMYVYNQQLFYSKDYQLWKHTDATSNFRDSDKESFTLYPNPSSEFIILSTAKPIKRFKIFDINGKLVINRTDFNSNTIDISELKQGEYIIQCRINEKLITEKFTKL